MSYTALILIQKKNVRSFVLKINQRRAVYLALEIFQKKASTSLSLKINQKRK